MTSPTIRDVAKAAGVGVGTVSRVLNNSTRVSHETRERVLAAITSTGFRPNSAAIQLSSGKRLTNIGVILPYLTNYSFVERLRGVQIAVNAAASSGEGAYQLILYSVNSPQNYERQFRSLVERRQVEGVLVVALNISPTQQRLLDQAGIRYVGISDRCTDRWPCIGPDNVSGGFMVTEFLLKLGHTRIAYVGDRFPDRYGFPTSEDRYNGYVRALTKYGIDLNPDYVCLGEHGRDVAQALTAALLRLSQPPTAIFAMSDFQALGCMAAIREAGWHVPDDIAIMGFDDIEISHYVGLTTVRQHLEDSGKLGIQALIDLLHDIPFAERYQLKPLELIERTTTQSKHTVRG